MHEIETNGLRLYRFDHLDSSPGLNHGIFTRQGGVSAPPFDSLNVTFGQGDYSENIHRNRQRILQTMGGDAMAFLRQVHGNRVLIAEQTRPNGTAKATWPKADAMIASKPGLLLTIQVADCQPVFLYDPVQRVVANVHSGWRGSAANILGRTVTTMATDFNCRPADMLTGIGPSLGPCCAEFINYRTELPESLWSYKDERDHVDFWALSVDQLGAAGLRKGNIEVARICTRCATDRFFSYRAAKETGRFAAVIGLN